MKNNIRFLAAAVLCAGLIQTHAQMGPHGGMGGPSQGPNFGGAMAKLFGDNSSFSANMEMQVAGNQPITMPGKIYVSDGKSRFEMDMTEMKGHQMPPDAAAHMKAMGMDKMVTISLPEAKATYMIYPNMKAYVEMPIKNPDAAKPESDFKIETTEMGKETVDGHPCVKNKVVVTDDKGKKHESTVWNATDLKKFPVKIETTEQGHTTDMVFKERQAFKARCQLVCAALQLQKIRQHDVAHARGNDETHGWNGWRRNATARPVIVSALKIALSGAGDVPALFVSTLNLAVEVRYRREAPSASVHA